MRFFTCEYSMKFLEYSPACTVTGNLISPTVEYESIGLNVWVIFILAAMKVPHLRSIKKKKV